MDSVQHSSGFHKWGEVMEIDYHFEDFTEDNYRIILKLAKSNYKCINFSNYKKKGKKLLLRHDVDFSIHRAHKLARIEFEENMHSTFFLWMHCPFYNLFEEEVFDLVHEIIDLGHDIGLHFDAGFYARPNLNHKSILDRLAYEKSILEQFFGKSVSAFSFHNPTDTIILNYRDDCYHGMINAYSEYIRTNFEYCSDSNGYWRFKRLPDLLMQADSDNIHILIHPEWWTPEVMSPRKRITRCIEGRATKQNVFYDKSLTESRRENVR
jgi:hypothetical protein